MASVEPHRAHTRLTRAKIGEALCDRRDEVLPPDESAVEEAQRGRHDHDEGGGGDDPRGVSRVQRHVPRSTETELGGKPTSTITLLLWLERSRAGTRSGRTLARFRRILL